MNLVFKQQVPVTAAGVEIGSCTLKGFEFADRDEFRVEASMGDGLTAWAESERGPFFALCGIRKKLAEMGLMLVCNASAIDVYPSPMQMAMGNTTLAYRNRMGQQALSKDIVDIFGTDIGSSLGSVEEQETFHQKWLESL